jgi:hypothetical protein
MPELDDSIYARVRDLCDRGDGLADDGHLAEALQAFWSAWDLLPEPRTAYEAATWILAAIGDVNFQQGDFGAGRDNLATAMHCPDQCQFELGNVDRAADELARARLLGGPELFEDEEPKYLEFIMSRLEEPPGGW